MLTNEEQELLNKWAEQEILKQWKEELDELFLNDQKVMAEEEERIQAQWEKEWEKEWQEENERMTTSLRNIRDQLKDPEQIAWCNELIKAGGGNE